MDNILGRQKDQTRLGADQLKYTKKMEICKPQLTHNPEKMRFGRAGDISDSTLV